MSRIFLFQPPASFSQFKNGFEISDCQQSFYESPEEPFCDFNSVKLPTKEISYEFDLFNSETNFSPFNPVNSLTSECENNSQPGNYPPFSPTDFPFLCFAYKGPLLHIARVNDRGEWTVEEIMSGPASFIYADFEYENFTGRSKTAEKIPLYKSPLSIQRDTIDDWKWTCVNLQENLDYLFSEESYILNTHPDFMPRNGGQNHKIKRLALTIDKENSSNFYNMMSYDYYGNYYDNGVVDNTGKSVYVDQITISDQDVIATNADISKIVVEQISVRPEIEITTQKPTTRQDLAPNMLAQLVLGDQADGP